MELSNEFGYISKVTQDLLVMGTNDSEKFVETLAQAKAAGKVAIGTHSGPFHCDEVVACTMLLYTDKFRDAVIFRTRTQDHIEKLDIVCDVGGTYEPEKLRFDHHQRSFTDIFSEEYAGIKMSSAGLIYKHFGREIISNLTKQTWGTDLTEAQIDKIFKSLYKNFILEVDAIDNGVSESDNMRYQVTTGLESRVRRFNPSWNAPKGTCEHAQFKKAMRIAEEELIAKLFGQTQVVLPGFAIVKAAWDKKEEFHPSGQFLFFNETSCPWKSTIFDIEAECKQEGLIKFAFAQDDRKMWRIITVPPQPGSFEMRVPLKKEWRGLRETELKTVSGFADIDFVHNSGFIGGAWSLETVIKMAEESLEQHAALLKKTE